MSYAQNNATEIINISENENNDDNNNDRSTSKDVITIAIPKFERNTWRPGRDVISFKCAFFLIFLLRQDRNKMWR